METLHFEQMVNGPTDIERNKTPTCIDLIFTNRSNIVLENTIHMGRFTMLVITK